MSRRLQRLNVLFREELAGLIRLELRDPRLASVISITRVDISPDLENATVYVSVMDDEHSKEETIHALATAAPFLRRQLKQRVSIRKTPNLHFVLDLMRQVRDRETET